jgi:hypothetical protein
MKKLIIILFVLVSAFGAFAQTKSQYPDLPVNLAKWNGADSDKILKNPAIKTRLKNLLGKKSYAAFLESWETQNPIIKKGNFLFSSGCLIHACGHAESAMAIDFVNQTIHVSIFRETEKTKYFNEKGRKTPASIKNWANRLSQK